ncbi:MAG TPA: hypothetical protein VFG87_13395 [Amycolatopsis sp.]|nr:hypothetical protein [Amycolatopsis sp.]
MVAQVGDDTVAQQGAPTGSIRPPVVADVEDPEFQRSTNLANESIPSAKQRRNVQHKIPAAVAIRAIPNSVKRSHWRSNSSNAAETPASTTARRSAASEGHRAVDGTPLPDTRISTGGPSTVKKTILSDTVSDTVSTIPWAQPLPLGHPAAAWPWRPALSSLT